MTRFARGLRAALPGALALLALAGCATSGAPSQAQRRIMEDEAQRQRLNDAGFPQYNGQG
jgi:hypothetical protein